MKTTRVSCTSPATPPKLRLDSFPSLMRPETPGMATPPIHLPGSVPFRWEEAPGRPRPRPYQIPAVDRTLDPPPRMRGSLDLASQLAEEIGESPELERPYARILSARSFAEGRSTCGAREGRRKAGWSWRKKVGRRDHVVSGSEGISPSSSSSSSSSSSGSSSAVYSSSLSGYYDSSLCRFGCAAGLGEKEEDEGVEERLRARRLGRSRSMTSFSSHATTTSSHWLANLYEILRQAIPRSKGH